MAGNVWEWTTYVIADNNAKPSGSGGAGWSEYNTVSGTSSMAKSDLISNSWTSTQGVGQFRRGSQNSGGALFRGGAFGEGSAGGIFTANINIEPSFTASHTGFRCVRL